jgi:DNA ligase-1
LLKVKNFHDAEAVVIAHQAGKGKHKGKLGSLVVQLADATEFCVGTGLSDVERASPPTIGSTITFRYQELTDGGVPRFPSFLRVLDSTTTATTTRKESKTKSSSTSAKVIEKARVRIATAGENELRYFEFSDDKSSKFWEISKDNLDVTVRYGRIGTSGQTKSKSFDTEDGADKHYYKLVKQKTNKGYEEATRPE